MRTWIVASLVALVGCGSSASPDGALTAASSTGGSASQCACERGERGMQGPQGPQGERGSQGPMGNEGPEGPEGLAGLNGEPGPRGPEGAMGPRGPEGVSGQIGPRGPQGPQGPGGFDPSRIYVVENQGQFAHNGFTIVQASCDPGVDRVIAGGCNAKPYENGGQQIAKLHRFASYRSLVATWRCEAQFVEGTEPMTGDLIAQAICYDVDGNRTNN